MYDNFSFLDLRLSNWSYLKRENWEVREFIMELILGIGIWVEFWDDTAEYLGSSKISNSLKKYSEMTK